MKGKVLVFDAAAGTGIVNGEDGKRYAFTAADNKSPNPPKANDEVDFVADGANAKDIFVVTAAAAPAASIDMSKIAADPNVKNILAKPNVIWAAIVILGSLIGGYFTAITYIGGGPYGMMGAGGFFYALLFFIPVAAGVLIFFELTNHAMTSMFRLIAGGLAAAGPIVLPLIGNALLPGLLGAAVSMGGGMGGILSVGSIITIAGGVLILLTHFGIIKKLG